MQDKRYSLVIPRVKFLGRARNSPDPVGIHTARSQVAVMVLYVYICIRFARAGKVVVVAGPQLSCVSAGQPNGPSPGVCPSHTISSLLTFYFIYCAPATPPDTLLPNSFCRCCSIPHPGSACCFFHYTLISVYFYFLLKKIFSFFFF